MDFLGYALTNLCTDYYLTVNYFVCLTVSAFSFATLQREFSQLHHFDGQRQVSAAGIHMILDVALWKTGISRIIFSFH